MLKVAMLSGWHVHADGYAKEFSSLPDVALNYMWDEDAARGAEFSKKYGMEFIPSLDELLAKDDVDAVCVNAPTNMHRDVIVKAAKAGKHVFTEKVLAATNKEAGEIKKAVEEAGIKFCISFPHRTSPNNLYAKKIMDKGLLGKVTLLRVRNAHGGMSFGWLPPHFMDPVTCGGGAMMDLGAHPMYLIGWLMGRPVEVSSAFTYVYGKEIDDNAVTLLTYADGAVAVSETGFVSGYSPYSLELYGTEGTVLIGQSGTWVKSSVNKELDGYVSAEQMPEALPSPIKQFVGGILRGEKIHFGIDDAAALTELMEAAYLSHREGRHIKL